MTEFTKHNPNYCPGTAEFDGELLTPEHCVIRALGRARGPFKGIQPKTIQARAETGQYIGVWVPCRPCGQDVCVTESDSRLSHTHDPALPYELPEGLDEETLFGH